MEAKMKSLLLLFLLSVTTSGETLEETEVMEDLAVSIIDQKQTMANNSDLIGKVKDEVASSGDQMRDSEVKLAEEASMLSVIFSDLGGVLVREVSEGVRRNEARETEQEEQIAEIEEKNTEQDVKIIAMEVKITQKIREQDQKMEDIVAEFKRDIMAQIQEMLAEQNSKIEDQQKKILSQEEMITLQGEKISEYNRTLGVYNLITGETIEAFKTEVREELGTKFTQQKDMITAHKQTAEDVREELQNKIAEQEEIVNDVSEVIGNIGKVVAASHPQFSGMLGDAYNRPTTNTSNNWTQIFEHPTEFALKKNNLLTTIPSLTKEWVVEFSFKPTNLEYRGWTCILQMTMNKRYGSYGDRTPAVLYNPSFGLQVASSVNNNHNFQKGVPSATVGEWTKIRVSQELMDNKLKYRVIINGVEKVNVENKNAVVFQNVKVFAANPWQKAQPGFVKDLSINIKEE